MVIVIMRHAPTDMEWPERMDSRSFDAATKAYKLSHICGECQKSRTAPEMKVWSSTERRAFETAKAVFPENEILQTDMLNEVPLGSFLTTRKLLPRWVWMVCGRGQWFFNIKWQPEIRQDTEKRAEKLLGILEERRENCILVSHGFFLNVFIRICRRSGYRVTRGSLFRIRPLEKIRLAKRDMFCGGCSINCLMSSPKCQIGREKATRKGF